MPAPKTYLALTMPPAPEDFNKLLAYATIPPGTRMYPLNDDGQVDWKRSMTDVDGSEGVLVVGALGVPGIYSEHDPRTPWRIIRFCDGEEYAVESRLVA